MGGLYSLSIEDTLGMGVDRTIMDFMTGESGYPLQVLVPGSSSVLDTLQDKDALVRYFSQMLAASNSPIVIFLAFIRRQRNKD